MPTSLRDYFTLQGNTDLRKAVLVKSQQEPCLWLFPVQHWHTILAMQQDRLNERESRLFMHYMVSDICEIEIDRTSRVLVPRKLREHAGIGEDVILVGMYDRLEVWGSQVWLSHLNELEEEHEMSLSKVLSMPSIKPSFPGVEVHP